MALDRDRERFAELAATLEQRIDSLTAEVLAAQVAVLPAWLQEPPLWGRVEAATRALLATEIAHMREGGRIPESCPEVDAAVAREFASSAAPVVSLLAGYRSAHRVLWERWSRLLDTEGPAGERGEELRRAGSDFLFDYAERISALAAEEHARSGPAGSEQMRLTAVRALLDGSDDVDSALLGYPVDRNHLGLVGSGRALVDALPEIAHDLDCRLLLLDVYEDPLWAWLGRARPFAAERRLLAERLSTACGADGQVGLGSEGAGPAGMRRSNAEAGVAFGASGPDRPLVLCEEVALEDLAGRDREAAAEFVRRELAPLGRGAKAERLRATIAAYFAAGHNARACAKNLGIHHQTVAQRLAAAEALIGAPVVDRRVELETALRLERHLARTAPRG